MSTTHLLIDTAAMDHLLGEIADTREKLDVLVYLHGAGFGTHTTIVMAEALRLPGLAVAEALCALAHAGVVTTFNEDGAGWWLDPYSGWRQAIASVAEIYDHDRLGLLRRITCLALTRMRAQAGGELVNVIVLRPKAER